ncbi:MAG: RidA family protein [Rudaea sp.]|uniref:RidA family protein n=1 Tax=Rudaea sp. TaxID=2136325 RepID=UPI0039E57BCF
MKKPVFAIVAAAMLSACAPPAAVVKDVERVRAGSFPIASAVVVPAGQSLVFVSGMGGDVINKDAPKDKPTEAYGDTEVQTVSALAKIEATLKGMGLSMKDVVKMQVFLVGDPGKGGKLDFAGLMKGYTKFFGTAEQPNVPARSAMQVAALANPGWLVEIEVTAARK